MPPVEFQELLLEIIAEFIKIILHWQDHDAPKYHSQNNV